MDTLCNTKKESTFESINKQIEILRQANYTHLSYLDVINVSSNEYASNMLTDYQVWVLHQKCQILSTALHLAKKNMNTWTWEECCRKAITYGAIMGLTLTKQTKTVMKWYRKFQTQ